MGKKRTVEIRIVCNLYGQAGHSSHVHPKSTLQKARQAVIDFDHHVEMLKASGGHPFYEREAPYRIQTREVDPWTDLEDEG